MEFDEAQHLLSRTSFSANTDSIARLLALSRQQAVESILNQVPVKNEIRPPVWIDEFPLPPNIRKSLNDTEKKEIRKKTRRYGLELKMWWFELLTQTTTPFFENMILFWHNHFTSSLQKVHWPGFMYQQNMLLRQHALGSFSELLYAISKDPAMIIYLDNVNNHKSNPNENFARELLELFTLGEGNYAESDIREAARAFTGWKINRKTGKYRLAHRKHDFGPKSFLGYSGNFNGEDIIDILLKQPETAIHITKKAWKYFVALMPNEMEIDRIANEFRNSNYQIRILMQEIFLSNEFWNLKNRGALIKSPVDLLVATIRGLNIHVHDFSPIVRISRRLGQDLFNPPNVKGWSGGTDWISTDSLLARQSILDQFTRSSGMHHNKTSRLKSKRKKSNKMQMSVSLPMDFMDNLTGGDPDSSVISKLLLPLAPITTIDNKSDRYETLIQTLVDPVYQLK